MLFKTYRYQKDIVFILLLLLCVLFSGCEDQNVALTLENHGAITQLVMEPSGISQNATALEISKFLGGASWFSEIISRTAVEHHKLNFHDGVYFVDKNKRTSQILKATISRYAENGKRHFQDEIFEQKAPLRIQFEKIDNPSDLESLLVLYYGATQTYPSLVYGYKVAYIPLMVQKISEKKWLLIPQNNLIKTRNLDETLNLLVVNFNSDKTKLSLYEAFRQ